MAVKPNPSAWKPGREINSHNSVFCYCSNQIFSRIALATANAGSYRVHSRPLALIGLALENAVGLNIDLGAGEFRCQSSVLTLFANRQRQLEIGNQNSYRLGRSINNKGI